MTSDERDVKVKKIFDTCFNILTHKGRDYSGDADCLKNFRRFGSYGILVRMNDKIERLIHLDHTPVHEWAVKESIADTAMDLINYAALYLIVKDTEPPPVEWPEDSEDYCRGDVPCEKKK